MDFAGRFKAFFADNANVGNPEDPKLDLVVAFCMPTLDGMHHFSRAHLWSTTSMHVKYVINAIGENTYLDYGRNRVVEVAREVSAERFGRLPDYYLWTDQDNVVPNDLFKKLYLHNLDIVSGLYPKKTNWDWCLEPTQEFKDWDRRKDSIKGGLIECKYVGFGAILIKGAVFEKIGIPWFMQKTDWIKMNGKQRLHEEGEDVYFCRRAREEGYKIWCDTTIEIGHTGATLWPKDAFAMRRLKQTPGHVDYEKSIDAKDPELVK